MLKYADIELCLHLTRILVAAWVILSSAEWLANLQLFRQEGLLSWNVMRLRSGNWYTSKLTELLARPQGVRLVFVAQLLTSVILVLTSKLLAIAICLVIIVICRRFISSRTLFGGDGSDQMGAIISAGSLIMSIGLYVNDLYLATSGIFLIAGQAAVSYFTAGAAKLVSPVWRSGRALPSVMNTQTYGHAYAAKLSATFPKFSGMFCWTVIVTEMCFPLVLVSPTEIAYFGLICFAAFHISNGVFMGLNVFIISFIGTYPSVIYINKFFRSILFEMQF